MGSIGSSLVTHIISDKIVIKSENTFVIVSHSY